LIKATFKQIFRDYDEAFWQPYGHYFRPEGIRLTRDSWKTAIVT
jgi:hypothetical protein